MHPSENASPQFCYGHAMISDTRPGCQMLFQELTDGDSYRTYNEAKDRAIARLRDTKPTGQAGINSVDNANDSQEGTQSQMNNTGADSGAGWDQNNDPWAGWPPATNQAPEQMNVGGDAGEDLNAFQRNTY